MGTKKPRLDVNRHWFKVGVGSHSGAMGGLRKQTLGLRRQVLQNGRVCLTAQGNGQRQLVFWAAYDTLKMLRPCPERVSGLLRFACDWVCHAEMAKYYFSFSIKPRNNLIAFEASPSFHSLWINVLPGLPGSLEGSPLCFSSHVHRILTSFACLSPRSQALSVGGSGGGGGKISSTTGPPY